MYKITELKGVPRVFNLNNNSSLRLYAHQSISLSNELTESLEIVGAEKLGHISVVKIDEETIEATKKNKGGKK